LLTVSNRVRLGRWQAVLRIEERVTETGAGLSLGGVILCSEVLGIVRNAGGSQPFD
jgi:hypothetical protein